MSDVILAAGAVLWRPGPRGPEVLLVHRAKYDDWSLPKGKREPGEHLLITAVREVEEETSVRPVLGPPLRSVSYLYHGLPKQVSYWAARASGDAAASHEIDQIAWLPLAEATARLSYAHDADVVAGLIPVGTVPLIIVRHAVAGPKTGDDLRRPLEAKGERDATALAGLLACFAPRARVLSSPALRCVSTVSRYADLAGVPVEEDPQLAITNGGNTPDPLIRQLVAARRPAVVCLHRENLPAALAAACSALGAGRPTAPGLPKGGFWVVHAGPGGLAGLERHAPAHRTGGERYLMRPPPRPRAAGAAAPAGSRRRPPPRRPAPPARTASTC
jgi:8-oxo-dGTP pyrophosphatase MutT (NUDIX family)/phosphohistidine phosphatase SixA